VSDQMTIDIVRRKFIATFGGAVAMWPLAARAQSAGKLPTIGVLGAATPSAWKHYVAAFEQRLRELDWIEGRTVAIEYRWAEGSPERYADIAAEFVRLKVDVIVTTGGAVISLKKATSVIPIVFAMASDPVGGGLVASLARPGGNVTGLSLEETDLAGKRLGLLREVLPELHHLAVLVNVGNPGTVLEVSELEATARTLGIASTRLEIRRTDDIAPAFEGLKNAADALYVVADPLTDGNRVRIETLALAARLPTMHDSKEFIEAGGLMSYGPNEADLFRRAGDCLIGPRIEADDMGPARRMIYAKLVENQLLLRVDPSYLASIKAAAVDEGKFEGWVNGSWEIGLGGGPKSARSGRRGGKGLTRFDFDQLCYVAPEAIESV
jgi:putative tryptophan/tyrosine transport system substrate-binding protein